MAPMTGAPRRLRVGVAGASLPGEEPLDIDLLHDPAAIRRIDAGTLVVTGSDGVSRTARVGLPWSAASGTREVEVVVDGWRFELTIEDAARAELRRRATRAPDASATSGAADIRAIIPGRVAAVRVTAGDVVEAGQTLLVVEAMKMQNELRAIRAGTVERVAVGEGQTIDAGDLLVVVR